MIFSEHFYTKFHDTGASRVLRPSASLVYMQEVANLQFIRNGLSLDRTRDEEGLAFILSRIAIKFHKPLYAYEDIESQTWTCPSKGYAFNRSFRILKDGQSVAEAVSLWALIDLNTMQLQKTDRQFFDFGDEPLLQSDVPLRFRIPHPDQLECVAERKIVYSDIDYNMHMNNTHYPDLFCDYIPDMEHKWVTELSVSWIKEAHYGATVKIHTVEDEQFPGLYYFRLIGMGGETLVEARVKTETL